jgi:hypothetical protein
MSEESLALIKAS